MLLYQCQFVDHGGNIRDIQSIDADHDQAAIDRAHALNIDSIGAGFDLWHGDRRVHSHRNNRSPP